MLTMHGGAKRYMLFFRKVVRIENEINGEWKPVYTKFDGVITPEEPLVKVGSKYYTLKFLEDIINQNKNLA